MIFEPNDCAQGRKVGCDGAYGTEGKYNLVRGVLPLCGRVTSKLKGYGDW